MTPEEILPHYIKTGLWTDCFSGGERDESAHDNYDVDDLHPDTLEEITGDLQDFIDMAGKLLDGLDPEQVGHDFWLTKNGHGTGFWDRGLGERGIELTEIAKTFGSETLVIDNGKIHLE